MTDQTSVAPAGSDERITFRGPVQRMLISPEIGALIGTIMVWALFWATSNKFSTALTTASWLDGAAPLGIMAVAVALLMIGGEFDLSAGVMTGSTGILVGLFAQKFMGDGATMWLAVPVAFLAAAVIGWMNGTFVNRTGLPSFIVTLATFFVLRGVNLVFSKRLVDKVLVENIDEVKSFEPFRKVFASTHTLETFSTRDTLLLLCAIVGGALLVAGLLEQSLVRRSSLRSAGVAVAAVGLVAGALGVYMLHHSDGVGANVLWGAVALLGAIVATVGWADARYERGSVAGGWVAPAATRPLLAGVALTVLAFVITRFLDAKQERVLLSIPPHGLKVLIGIVAAVAGAGGMFSLGARRLRANVGVARRSRLTWPRLVAVAAVAGLVALVAVLSFLQLCTEQGFRSLVQVGLGAIGILVLLNAKGVAGRHSGKAQLLVA
ncbi:MAG: hypothetical protein RLZ14_778, partial [Actinomycetota bacterium]